ncbi:MAG TPA: hypothetical protein VGN23_13160 [Verrucomicrobiae bacterium]|jgi:hypothetical protein
MKTTNRVRKNPTRRTPTAQADKPAEFALPKEDCHPSCLVIFDRSCQKPVSKIPLSEKEFFNILTMAGSRFPGIGGNGQFIAAAIRQKLSTSEVTCQDAVNLACAKARTMLQLLADKFEMIGYGHSQFDGATAKDFTDGLTPLVREVIESIDAAESATKNAFHPHTAS